MVTTRSGAVYPRPSTRSPADADAGAVPHAASASAARGSTGHDLAPRSPGGAEAADRTRVKAVLAALHGRLQRLPDLTPQGMDILQVFAARAAEFEAIADKAVHGPVPLPVHERSRVLLGLARRLTVLATSDHLGYMKLLGVLEHLDPHRTDGAPPATQGQAAAREAEQARAHLAIALGEYGKHRVADPNLDRGALFDRLHAVMQGLTTPEAHDLLADHMPLAGWYMMTPTVIGSARFDATLRWVEERQATVADESRASAIGTLAWGLRQHADVEGTDVTSDFDRLRRLALPISSADLKASAATQLAGAVRLLPDGARAQALDGLFDLLDTIEGADVREDATRRVERELNA